MSTYAPPTFTAIPMAMICSKTGCPRTSQPFSAKPPISITSSSSDPLIAVPQDISTRADSGFTYIYEPGAQLVFELNEVAGAIIGCCIGAPKRLTDISSFVNTNFQKAPPAVADEIYGFILNLKSSGFNLTLE